MITRLSGAPILPLLLVLAACGSAPSAPNTGGGHGASSLPPAVASEPGAVPPVAQPSAARPGPSASPAARAAASSAPAQQPAASPAAAGTVVSSWNSPKYGQILVDSRGRVLYLFTPDDATGTPNCTGSCAAAWPPFTPSAGAPRAEGAVQQSKLSVSGGQIAYSGHPLYFYAADSGPQQTNGQCSGRIWYVIGVDGSAITTC